MLVDGIGVTRLGSDRWTLDWWRDFAGSRQVHAQCRRVPARATTVGRVAVIAVVRWRAMAWLRRSAVALLGLHVWCHSVQAVHIRRRRGVREAARDQLPQEQCNDKTDAWAPEDHAGILSPPLNGRSLYMYGATEGNSGRIS
jgi:hypothetical protein